MLLGDLASIPFQELYEILARQRPDEIALLAKQLQQLPPGPQAEAKIKAFFTAWAHLDPNSAFTSALDLRNPQARISAIGAIITGADADAAGALAASISQMAPDLLPDPARFGLFNQAIEKWSESDPAGAARLLSATKLQGAAITSAFYMVANNWGERDPAAALAWAEQQHVSPLGLNPIAGAVSGRRNKDPAAAEAYALSRANTALGKQLIPNIANQIANQDRARATDWASKIPDKDVRNQTYTILAAQLAITDPKSASNWALTLPPDAMAGAVTTSVSMWARSDPTEAGHWLENLSGSVRDSAVISYSETVAESDPSAAMGWAATISDPAKRERATKGVMRQWLENDPAAARAWVQSSSLGEEEKTKLLASPAPSP